MKMDIKEQQIKIKDLVEGYVNNDEEGVIGYGGKLNIRPIYQREFRYGEKEKHAVINTVLQGFPLNTFYWAKNNENGFEVLDGQQRTLSICEYFKNRFSYTFPNSDMPMYYDNLQPDHKEKFLNYKILTYLCSGTPSQKLEWFEVINIKGLDLTPQERKNAVFAGPWTTDAKRYFSKTGCAAYGLAGPYLRGVANKQEYLETAIKWISKNNISEYMGLMQNESSANQLWLYFNSVIEWVKINFPNYRREMKGIEWGFLYNEFKDKTLDPNDLEKKIGNYMQDDEIQRKKGIYEYLLTGKEKFLNLRTFTENQKREMYERQEGKCAIRGTHYPIEEMEADHIKRWVDGGKTVIDVDQKKNNGRMIHKDENRRLG